LKLKIRRPASFKYLSGQWIRVTCGAASVYENHPFTLMSAPHERLLEIVIRVCGPWTKKMYELYEHAVENGEPLPSVNIEGPYGESYQRWADYHVSVLTGASIGITPFVSVLKDFLYQLKTNDALNAKKIYLIWVCRSQRQFEWVIDVLREVEETDVNGILEVHIYITALRENFDLRTSLMYVCERQFHKINGTSLVTGLQAATHFGRPRFETVFRQILQRHNDERVIAMFTCGSPVVIHGVEEAIAAIRAKPRPGDPVINQKSLAF